MALVKPEKFSSQCDINCWFGQFELFLILTEITDDTKKRNYLLSYLDLTIYQAVTCARNVDKACYDDIKKFLVDRYSTTDEFMERIDFFASKFSLPADSFASQLNRHLDRFDSTMDEFKEQLMVAKFISCAPTMYEKELRLRRPTTVSACVEICNAMPVSTGQVGAVNNKPFSKNSAMPNPKNKICFRCGSHNHIASFPGCPAKNATCRSCQKNGHFQKMCKSKDFSSKVNVSSIFSATKNVGSVSVRPDIDLSINAVRDTVNVIVDTGSEVSILSYDVCKRHNLKVLPIKDDLSFCNFDDSPLKMRGKTEPLEVHFNGKHAFLSFYVACVRQSVLGIDGVQALRLVISCCASDPVNASVPTPPALTSVASCDRFDKIAKIRLLPDAPTTLVQRVRRLPFSLEDKVEHELRKMLADDVIEEISSSPYVSPIVVVPKKSGDIRICVDYRKINPHVIPDPFPIPSIDDVLARLNRPTVFSLIDLKAAYHQIEIDDESRDVTSFITNSGLFRFKKLPFGLSCSPGIFVRTVHSVLKDIPNVLIYFDDILLYGQTQAEHDQVLKKVMDALNAAKFTINEDKSKFNVKEVEFLGRTLSCDGIQLPSEAFRAVRELPVPTSKKEMQSFLGMVSYFRSCVPHFTEITAPLYSLLKDNVSFDVTPEITGSIASIKKAVVESAIMGFFDTCTDTETILTTDASRNGIGGMLSQVQDGVERPIYFVSRKLTAAEMNYSVPELETLAVVWCTERLRQYVYGRRFKIRTDHSSLRQVMTGKTDNSLLSGRVARWAIRLMPYCFTVEYISGAKNVIADCLSRLPIGDKPESKENDPVSVCIVNSVPISFDEIRKFTAEDEVLSDIHFYIVNEWPHSKEQVPDNLRPYFPFRDSLSVHDSVIMRGDRIVVPALLQKRLIDLAHEHHFGIVKTKSRLRASYWWLGMDNDVESSIRQCFCFQNTLRESPVQLTEWELRPWAHLAMDIAGPKTDVNGKTFYVLAIVDIHSKYVAAKILPHVKSSDVIDFLENLFMTFGFCTKLTTDNGTQFTSAQFVNFLKSHGISHIRSAIYNPQANGQIERVNRNFKKVLENAKLGSKVIYSEMEKYMQKYLFSYNNTVHETTNECPSKMLLNYVPRTYLTPCSSSLPENEEKLLQMKEEVQSKTEKRAAYANDRRRPLTKPYFQEGDWVQKPPGPIRRIVSRVGPYTFKLNDGFTVNARNLILIKRPPCAEYVDMPAKRDVSPRNQQRYPKRAILPPARYGFV